MAWALAQIAASVNLRGPGVALLFIALGFAIQPSYPSSAQAIEALLLAIALAMQARGRTDYALAMVCAAVFAKPSMGFVYCLLLLLLIVRRHLQTRDARPRALLVQLVPALATAFVLIAILTCAYGSRALVTTLLPLQGIANYRTAHFGFFGGSGREFWDPTGMPWAFYLVDVSGFWIAATLFLAVAGTRAAIRLWKAPNHQPTVPTRRDEIIVTCAILHLAFVSLFFGNQWSWIYYSYILVAGAAIAADVGPVARRLSIGLCLLALFGWTHSARLLARWWRSTSPSAETAMLWSSPAERAEWSSAIGIAQGHRASLLDIKGSGDRMFAVFMAPVTLNLEPGLMDRQQIVRKLAQLAVADVVVVPTGIDIEACRGIPDAPEFRSALEQFKVQMTGKFFTVYVRRGVSGHSRGSTLAPATSQK
jgi:hypothetical protein